MYKHSELTIKQLRLFYAVRLSRLVYPQTAAVQLQRWDVGGEPVDVQTAEAASYEPADVGAKWGGLWDTTWFRISGEVPESFAGQQAIIRFKLDTGNAGEGFTCEGLVWHEGKPITAINGNRSDIAVANPAKGGETFSVLVEAASNTSPDGRKPDYRGKPLFEISQCELAVWDREVWAAAMDFEVLLNMLQELDQATPRWGEILFGLNQAMQSFDYEDDKKVAVAKLREQLQPLLTKRNGDTTHHISAIGHAHIDTAWLWPLRECVRKCARTFSTALNYMQDYPAYVFGCSQAAQYSWIKKHYPTIWQDIQAAVKRGQWEPIGSMWVETDCNIPSGESLVRQILHGKRFFEREFGIETTDVWIPDVFGYSASFPQVMKLAGIDSFLTQKISWNQFNRFPHHTFLWQGIDGTQMFTHFPPADTYNAVMTPKENIFSVKRFQDHDRATRSLLAYGYGDGGGGPTREMLERAARMKDLEGTPKVTLEKVEDFFKKAKADAVDLPVWVGELYLELHRATYTSQARTKRGNRKCEFALHDAELLDAVDWLFGSASSREISVLNDSPPWAVYETWDDHQAPERRRGHAAALDRAWKLVLLNQFHDIIPGSSINWVYQDNLRDYDVAMDMAMRVSQDSLPSLAQAVDRGTAKSPLLVVNTTGFCRREFVSLADGSRVHVEVPPTGYAVVDASETSTLPEATEPVCLEQTDTGYTIRNGLLSLEVDTDGHLTSLLDHRADDRQVIPAGSKANLLQLHFDWPHSWDAWEVDPNCYERAEDLTEATRVEVVESSPACVIMEIERKFRSSVITQHMTVHAGSARIDFDGHVDWHEHRRFLKVAFPVEVHAPQATFEIQYGHLQRPTHANTSWDMAQFEVCAQKWADLSESGYGVALLNDCKYGYDIKGNTMRLSLLRGPIRPDPFADEGEHRFSYALLPHPGTWQQAGVLEAAYALNVPLKTQALEPATNPTLPSQQSFVSFDKPGVVIEAVKVSEDGDAVIVRFYEGYGSRGKATMSLNLPVSQAVRADLLERDGEALALEDGRITFDLKPFEIVTVKLTR